MRVRRDGAGEEGVRAGSSVVQSDGLGWCGMMNGCWERGCWSAGY